VVHGKKGKTIAVGHEIGEANAEDYAALVLPGGVANPDQLRADERVVDFVRRFAEAERPIAAICHGPWTLIEAEAVKGKRITSWPSLKTDLENAGAHWVDEEVVVEGKLITSRKPDDLPAFCRTIVEQFQAA
jgi:protease I